MANPEDTIIVELTPGSAQTLLDLRYALRVLDWARGAYSWNPKMERAYRRLRRAIRSLDAGVIPTTPGAKCPDCDGHGRWRIPLSHTAPRDEITGLVGQYREETCERCKGTGVVSPEGDVE